MHLLCLSNFLDDQPHSLRYTQGPASSMGDRQREHQFKTCATTQEESKTVIHDPDPDPSWWMDIPMLKVKFYEWVECN